MDCTKNYNAQAAGAVEYTDCVSADGKDPHPTTTIVLDMTLNNPVLELWGMWHNPSLPLLHGPLWSAMVAHGKVLSIGQIELLDIKIVCKQMTDAKLNCYK